MNHPVYTDCGVRLQYSSPKGCPVVSLSKFNFFINKYYFLFGAILIVAGILMAFFGNKFVNIVIYGVTTLTVFLILGNSLFNWIMENSNHQWV
tara:strand:+ start:636 stop:914 length:279 start_codon:yes stop_codon:yes gene_type:complete